MVCGRDMWSWFVVMVGLQCCLFLQCLVVVVVVLCGCGVGGHGCGRGVWLLFWLWCVVIMFVCGVWSCCVVVVYGRGV